MSRSAASGPAHLFRGSEQDWDRIAVAAIVLGASLRILWILVIHPPVNYLYSDMRVYVLRALQLGSGAPLTPDDAFFPPGTQMLLSVPLGLFGVEVGLWVAATLWCVLSVATIYMSWRLTRNLLTSAAAALTALLCAIWPLFISYGGYFTSETPALAFLVAALWAGTAAQRSAGRWASTLAVLSGVLGGAASAIRPQLLINITVLVAIIIFTSRRAVALVSCMLIGLAAVLGLVVIHNSLASNQLTGLARNGGLNFWFGHCKARSVTILDAENKKVAEVRHPVPSEAGRSGDYIVRNQALSDDDFFVGLGRECIEQDGLGHVLRLGRNVFDMTASTTPWPQSQTGGWPRGVVQASNVVYSVLLVFIVIGSIDLIRRRKREGKGGGEVFMVLNLVCIVMVAILVLGDPRVRTVYDVFGFALLGALLADRLHLDEPSQADAGGIDP